MANTLRFLLLLVLLSAVLVLGATDDEAVESTLDAENATPITSETKLPAAKDEGEQPLTQRSGRPERRVYDPVSGLFCELASDCLACPVSEKVASPYR